jgi:cytochrome c
MANYLALRGKAVVGPLVLVAFLLGAAPSQANEALARKNDCLGCHAVATKLVGPAYKDVAAKYAGQADAQAVLVQSIRNGSVGKWGELPMPAHPKISEADIKKLAFWVLSAK